MRILLPAVLLLIAFWVYSIVDCALLPPTRHRGVSKPVTLTFTWTPGAQPVLSGKATVKRLDFGVGGGDWADTKTIPNEVAVSTKVVLKPAK